jgi:diguanylate cyclase (GGDEF)-like protein
MIRLRLRNDAADLVPLLIVSLVLGTMVASVDLLVHDEFPAVICFLPSLLVASWLTQPGIGAALVAVCSAIWLIDDSFLIAGRTAWAGAIWLGVIHCFFCLVILDMQVRLRAAYRRERQLARRDGLTGLGNAMAFREAAELELERARRSGRPIAVAFLDCDNFKTVNDSQGHRAGDALLKTIAETLAGEVRKTDAVARLGGDEFAILFPETTRCEAAAVSERLRDRLQAAMVSGRWSVTFSMGVAVYGRPPESVDDLIQGADALMYQVKQDAKDGVLLAHVA